jgi:hypothetical protein
MSRWGTRKLCGRALTEATFLELGYGELLYRVAARLGSGFAVTDEAMQAVEQCMAAEQSGDWQMACIEAAKASDELWRTRMTLAGGGL